MHTPLEGAAMVELGINTCFAVKRWPRPADWAPVVRDTLDLDLVQVSLDLVDLTRDDESLARDVDDHLEAADRHGITIHSVFTGVAGYSSNLLLHPNEHERNAAERWYERAIEFTARLGAGSVGGHVGAYSVPDWTDAERRSILWEELKVRLGRLAAVAHDRGLQGLLIENLAARREPSTMADIESLITDGDEAHVPLQLCLDVGHMCVPETEGEERDPDAWLRRLGSRAAVIQIQQSDVFGDRHWPFTSEHDEDGRIHPSSVLETLGHASTAPLIFEVIPAFEAPDDSVITDLVESVRRWREAIDGFEAATD
jgi:sugar phosphate isomerase/epimerase